MSVMHADCKTQRDLEALIPVKPEGGWQGERSVYQFFQKHMPPDWHVFYNVHFDTGVRKQLDFLVCVPQKGIVNVDAKGKGYTLDDGQVYFNGSPSDIVDKAKKGRAAVDAYVRQLRGLGPREPWGAYAYLIVFARSEVVLPDTVKNDGFSILNWERNPKEFAERLTADIEQRLNQASSSTMNFPLHWSALLQAFEKCKKPFVANSKFDIWNGRADEVLTQPQSDVYMALRENRFCHVQGAAGTGKTLVALALAKEYAREGKHVLYVCYNKNLATYLRAMGEPKGLSIRHFHNVHKALGIQLKFGEPFNRETAYAIIKKELIKLPATRKFDVLLVDEAQDLTTDELRLLMTLIQDSGKAALFSDENQNIFTGPRDEGWEGDEAAVFDPDVSVHHLTLDWNYRNTEPICRYFSRNGLPVSRLYWTRLTLGEDPPPVEKLSRGELKKTLETVLERVPPGQIVLLGYNDDVLESITDFTDAQGRQVHFAQTIEEWLQGRSIWKTTVHGFKGIDAEVVFVLGDSSCGYERLKYIGESRAKYELYIVE